MSKYYLKRNIVTIKGFNLSLGTWSSISMNETRGKLHNIQACTFNCMVEHENTVFQELVRWGSSMSDMPSSAHCPPHSLPNNIIKIKARPNQQSVDT